MKQVEIEQIKTIITNFEEQKGYIPFLSDLENHPAFWPVFKTLHDEDKEDVKKIIDEYIVEKIENHKTKWGELFQRFFQVNEDMFWEFRDLNQKTDDPKFHELGKKVEDEMFKYEGILTERMLKQEKWLDKVLDSFYKIVYTYFPKYSEID